MCKVLSIDESMFPHGRYFEIQKKIMVAMLYKWHIDSCFGKTWYMNEWSANDNMATCTTHATTLFPRHANCYV
jgi:hypothetical protein